MLKWFCFFLILSDVLQGVCQPDSDGAWNLSAGRRGLILLFRKRSQELQFPFLSRANKLMRTSSCFGLLFLTPTCLAHGGSTWA